MRRLLVACVLILCACGPFGAENPDGPPKYTRLVFGDGFDSFDGTKWSPNKMDTAGDSEAFNGMERGCYAGDNVRFQDGFLDLWVTDGPCLGYPYRGASISTWNRQTFVAPLYVEARICLTTNSRGIVNWPAFWWDTTGSWPSGGEIDVMEGLGGNASATYHDSDGAQQFGNFGRLGGCHVYGAWWHDHTLTAYLDGHRVAGQATGVVHSPQFLILGAQVGGYGGDTVLNTRVRFDYVNVWSP